MVKLQSVLSNIEGRVTTDRLTKQLGEVRASLLVEQSADPNHVKNLPKSTTAVSNHHCPLNLTSNWSECHVFAQKSKPKRILLPSLSEKDIVK